jgi:hypothetical protein
VLRESWGLAGGGEETLRGGERERGIVSKIGSPAAVACVA